MLRFLDVAQTGLAAVRLHPLRSTAVVACLIVVLLPYSAGLALSQGLEAEAEASIRYGADLYVTGSRFGRTAPVPLTALEAIARLDGVSAVTPRIVGALALGKNGVPVVVVGMPPSHFPAAIHCIDGRLPTDGGVHELVVGTQLARRLGLEVGSSLPPFYRNDQGEKLVRVVGIFHADLPLWQANLVFTTFDSAAVIFNQRDLATDLLVDCRPGHEENVRTRLVREVEFAPVGAAPRAMPRVTTRADLEALLPAGLRHREGVFNLIWLLALAVAILVTAVTSGFGLSARRREIGILKATGWQTDEVLLRSAVESVILALLGGTVALLLAWVWLAWLNGYGIAGLFLAGLDPMPALVVPYRFTPVPALLALVLAMTVTLSGTLYSSWRAATVSPRAAMR